MSALDSAASTQRGAHAARLVQLPGGGVGGGTRSSRLGRARWVHTPLAPVSHVTPYQNHTFSALDLVAVCSPLSTAYLSGHPAFYLPLQPPASPYPSPAPSRPSAPRTLQLPPTALTPHANSPSPNPAQLRPPSSAPHSPAHPGSPPPPPTSAGTPPGPTRTPPGPSRPPPRAPFMPWTPMSPDTPAPPTEPNGPPSAPPPSEGATAQCTMVLPQPRLGLTSAQCQSGVIHCHSAVHTAAHTTTRSSGAAQPGLSFIVVAPHPLPYPTRPHSRPPAQRGISMCIS